MESFVGPGLSWGFFFCHLFYHCNITGQFTMFLSIFDLKVKSHKFRPNTMRFNCCFQFVNILWLNILWLEHVEKIGKTKLSKSRNNYSTEMSDEFQDSTGSKKKVEIVWVNLHLFMVSRLLLLRSCCCLFCCCCHHRFFISSCSIF